MPRPRLARSVLILSLGAVSMSPVMGEGAVIVPLDRPVVVGEAVAFEARGDSGPGRRLAWDFGDGGSAEGTPARHTYSRAGVYRVEVREAGVAGPACSAIVRARARGEASRPRVVLDTDAANDVDDQHYLAYALFRGLDVLAINSVHHGGGQESGNHAEILRVLDLARASGLRADRVPRVYRGADRPLVVPEGGDWADTRPIATEASAAILAAARGASPGEPAWIVPVGPCTNVASAILQARAEGLDLADRLRVAWLGGSPDGVRDGCFNGRNDPWSAYVLGRSGIPTWVVLEAPTGASLSVDTRAEPGIYPDSPLGRYLRQITPAGVKPLFDVAMIALVVGDHLGRPWLREVEPASILGPDRGYRWGPAGGSAAVHLVRDIDEAAMLRDFRETLEGRPTPLGGD